MPYTKPQLLTVKRASSPPGIEMLPSSWTTLGTVKFDGVRVQRDNSLCFVYRYATISFGLDALAPRCHDSGSFGSTGSLH